MAKDWEDLDYHQKDKKLYEYADQYGIDPGDYTRGERESGVNGNKGDWDDFENDVLAAAANDYDTRRSIEAGKAADNKRFAGIGDGINQLSELYDVNKALKGTHKDMGNTGKFSSTNDYGNVTSYLVEDQMEKFGSKFASSKAVDDLKEQMSLNQQSAQAGSGTEMKPVEHSEEIQQAKFAQDPTQINIYESTNVDGEGSAGELTGVSSGDSQRDTATKNFLDEYKVDLIKGLKLTPTLS